MPQNTTDGELLRRFNIGAVLNVAKEVSDPFADSPCLKPPPPAVPTSSSSSLLTEPQRIRVAASTPDLRAKFSDALTLLAHSHTIDYPETSSFPALSYLHVPFSHDVSNLAAALPGLIAFINHHLERGVSVLVHCQCGVSRSASVVVAWVMQAQQLAMHAAYDKVKEQSPYISPNISLLVRSFLSRRCSTLKRKHVMKQYQLVDFERSQKSPTSTHASSSLTSEEGDEDSLRTPPDETAFHHHHDEAIVNGLLSRKCCFTQTA